MVQQLGGSEWSVPGLGMGCGADYQVHICLVDGTEGWEAGWASAPLESSRRRSAAPWDLTLMGGMREGSLGPLALGVSILPPSLQGPPQKSPQAPGSLPLLSESWVHSTGVWASFGFLFLSQTVVPKIANPRNLREANTDANTRGFIYKLELVSKYTQQSGAGTWTLRWVLA